MDEAGKGTPPAFVETQRYHGLGILPADAARAQHPDPLTTAKEVGFLTRLYNANFGNLILEVLKA